MEIPVALTTEHIKLDTLLKLAGVTDSGGQAKILIREGLVRLNGEVTTQRGRKIRPGDRVDVADPAVLIVVSSAGG